jgi:hypothetical protein
MFVRAIKSDDGDWVLDVLGAPFGGPYGGRDSYGEYFTPETDFWLDHIATRPVVYYHGLREGAPEVIGREIKAWIDAAGVWFRVRLDQTKDAARRVWEAAQRGAARASSGAISHLVRESAGGRIDVWPIGELSLMDGSVDLPANPYAVALPAARALYRSAGLALPEGAIPEDPAQGSVDAPADGRTVTGEYRRRVLTLLTLNH